MKRNDSFNPVFFAFVSLGLAALVTGSEASASTTTTRMSRTADVTTGVKASVKPDFSYFAGHTITWIIPDPVGSSFQSSAAALAPLVGSYLHATVNLEIISSGAEITGQDAAAAATPDGLTIGSLDLSTDTLDFVTHAPSINFSLQKVGIIIGEPHSPTIYVASPTSGFTSIRDVLATKTPFNALDTTDGIDESERVIFGSYGVPAHILTGYTTATAVQGFIRGDGTVALAPVVNYAPLISQGQATPLLLSNSVLPGSLDYAQLKDVPTLASLYAKDKPKTAAGKAAIRLLITQMGNKGTNDVPFTPPGTPAKLVAALSDAFRSALVQAKQAFINLGLVPGYFSAAAVVATIKSEIKHLPIVQRYMSYNT